MYQIFSVKDINPQDRQALLTRFGIPDAPLFAQGSEAEVYLLDDTHLLKLYVGTRGQSAFETLKHIASHQGSDTPHIPQILDVIQHNSVIAVVEQRIKGVSLASVLPTLSTSEQERVESLYLDTVWKIKNLATPDTHRNYLLFDNAQRQAFASFGQYYAYHLRLKAQQVSDTMSANYPDFNQQVMQLGEHIAPLDAPLSLVHGDFYEGNIMVDEQATTVYGVIDFVTYAFIRGHYLLDIAGAFSFYRMYDPEREAIRARLLAKILARLTNAERPIFYQFLLANAIMTSNLYAGERPLSEDGHFNWALDIITNQTYWDEALV